MYIRINDNLNNYMINNNTGSESHTMINLINS